MICGDAAIPAVLTPNRLSFFFFFPCILSTFASSYLIQDKEYGELYFAFFFFSVKKTSAEHLIVVIPPTAKASVKEIKY